MRPQQEGQDGRVTKDEDCCHACGRDNSSRRTKKAFDMGPSNCGRRWSSPTCMMKASPRSRLRLALVVLMMIVGRAGAQYREGSPLYEREIMKEEAILEEQLKSLPDVELTFYPERAYDDPNLYIYSPPSVENYKIGLILDPCKGKEPDCCMNVFGTPEYGLKTEPDSTYPYRVVPKRDLGDDSEILANVDMVNEYRTLIDSSHRRRADDQTIVDDACNGTGDPFTYCTGFRKRDSPFPLIPACRDNNQTVNASKTCYDPDTKLWSENCVQVGYMQTALSVICGNEYAHNPHCGTFLEIHLPNGSPDYDVDYKISERQIVKRNTTGYLTTTIPLYFMGNDSTLLPDARRLLCAYEESEIRVGSSVLVKDVAPLCCCPQGYTMCPVILYDTGPSCPSATTLTQKLQVDSNWDQGPYCFSMPEDEDWVMCSKQSWLNRMVYYRCPITNSTTASGGGFGSSLIQNSSYYSAQCPYLPECVLAYEDANATTQCATSEDTFSFRGMVGTVTSIPKTEGDDTGTAATTTASTTTTTTSSSSTSSGSSDTSKYYGVTFNNGRSVYYFDGSDLILDSPAYNYELWWVQRTRYDFVIQKKKPFRVRSPTCTYDSQRQEYFPYAFQTSDGTILDTF